MRWTGGQVREEKERQSSDSREVEKSSRVGMRAAEADTWGTAVSACSSSAHITLFKATRKESKHDIRRSKRTWQQSAVSPRLSSSVSFAFSLSACVRPSRRASRREKQERHLMHTYHRRMATKKQTVNPHTKIRTQARAHARAHTHTHTWTLPRPRKFNVESERKR